MRELLKGQHLGLASTFLQTQVQIWTLDQHDIWTPCGHLHLPDSLDEEGVSPVAVRGQQEVLLSYV